jgi:hypothetical protein
VIAERDPPPIEICMAGNRCEHVEDARRIALGEQFALLGRAFIERERENARFG